MTDRIEVVLMGVTVGTASGRDEQDVCIVSFYDFQPNEYAEDTIPANACYNVDFNTGKMDAVGEDGEVEFTLDMLNVLKSVRINVIVGLL